MSENRQHAYDTGLRGSNGDNPDNLSGVELAQVFGIMPITISEIRAEYKFGVRGCSTHALAKKYGIGQNTIWRIVHGR